MYRFPLIFQIILFAFSQDSYATFVSIRLIKDKPSFSSSKPILNLMKNSSSYTIAKQEWYNGEDSREIFFELETQNKNIPLEPIKVQANDVTISRVIIGRTDVEFEYKDGFYYFDVIQDTTNGRHVQTPYQNPLGGPFLWIFHNSIERVNGKYLNVKYPQKAIDASLNFIIACQEMLRLMGNMSGRNQNFSGELVLLNCETSAPRAHLDFPPHWHLQHWQHGHNNEYGIEWREKQFIIPHYYLDSIGNLKNNKQSIHQNNNRFITNQEYLDGDTSIWRDTENHLIFKQVINKGGISFVLPNNDVWSLYPDKFGGNSGILIYKQGKLIERVKVDDDGIKGIVKIRVDYFKKDKSTGKWENQINYDPFTGKVL